MKTEYKTPNIFIPAVKIPQPDGSVLVKAGKPLVIDRELSVTEFSKLTSLSISYIAELCATGHIKHRRLSRKPRSKILIEPGEALRYRAMEGTDR